MFKRSKYIILLASLFIGLPACSSVAKSVVVGTLGGSNVEGINLLAQCKNEQAVNELKKLSASENDGKRYFALYYQALALTDLNRKDQASALYPKILSTATAKKNNITSNQQLSSKINADLAKIIQGRKNENISCPSTK